MAKYQEYAEYKDSSIEWLGDVPTDWKCLPIKYLCYVNDGNHGEEYPKESDYTIEELGVPFIRGGNILNFEVTDKDMLYITKEKNTSMRKGRLQVDDILFVNRGDIGKLALISEKHKGANLNSQIAYLRCKDKSINNKFLLYFLASVYVSNLLNSIKMGSVLTQFPIGNILEIKVPLPNSVEQIKISNFLDYETSKIDDLIAKQEKLIELLKEKRQAVISHAVTKGLNPNVPMKDSGVEWLGQVPEHWKICSLSKIFSIKAGGDVQTRLFSEIQTDEHKFPIYTNANNANSIYGYSKIANYSANSITVSGRGDVGFAVYRDHAFDAIIRLLVLTPQKTCYTKYFAYFINEVIDFKVESSAIGQLSTLQISPYKILFPPFDEQKLITEYLDNETIKIDTLIHKAESVIQLMQERRTVLISSAVTGKIDVRNWQNPTEAKMEFSA